MKDRIRPDYSAKMNIVGDEEVSYLLDPRYDFIRVFPWLKYGIVNVVTEEGIHRMYTTEEQCRLIHETAEIPLVELEWITKSEHENMIEIMANDLESWLE